MQRSQFAGHFGITLARVGILRAKIGDGRGLQRLGNGAGIGRRLPAGFDLVVFGLRVERQRVRRGEPLIAGRKLLVADRRVLGADEIVLRLVDRQCMFSALRSRSCNSLRRPDRSVVARRAAVGLRILRFRQIGVGDRVGEHRRLCRIVRPDVDIDDEGAVGLLDGDMTVQGVQRRHLAELDFAGGPDFEPEQAEQRCHQAPGLAAAELRILVEMGILDHLQQHVVRGDQARLAFDHHRQARNVLGARREFAIDQLQFAGIDIKLGGRGISSASGSCRS